MKPESIPSHAFGLKRMNAAVNDRRPENGFITRSWILDGWTGQPDYRNVRS